MAPAPDVVDEDVETPLLPRKAAAQRFELTRVEVIRRRDGDALPPAAVTIFALSGLSYSECRSRVVWPVH